MSQSHAESSKTPTFASQSLLSVGDKDVLQVIVTKDVAMARLQNASIPIAVLFPELLARIFAFDALSSPPHEAGFGRFFSEGRPETLGWISSATHVCHRWRQVAMDHPTLWGCVTFALGARWTEEMLLRSQGAPISVTWTPRIGLFGSAPGQLIANQLVPAQLFRVRELKIHDYELLEKILQSAMPAEMLEVLDLKLMPGESVGVPSPFIPSTFFKNKSSRLRSLSLVDLPPSWTSMPTVCLTRLYVFMQSTGGQRARAMDQFLDFLDGVPTLEELILHNCLPYNLLPHPSAGDRIVRMPRLRQITLGDPHPVIANVLRHIDTASQLQLELDLTWSTPDNVIPYHGPLIPDHLYTVLELLKVDKREDLSLDFSLVLPTPNLETLKLGNRMPIVAEDPALPTFAMTTGPKLRDLSIDGYTLSWDMLPVAQLTHLHVSWHISSSQQSTAVHGLYDRFLDCIEAANNLRVLHLEHCLPSSMVDSTHYNSTRVVTLPDLDWLTLHGPIIDIVTFFNHVKIPPSAHRRLQGHGSNIEYDSLSSNTDVSEAVDFSMDTSGPYDAIRVLAITSNKRLGLLKTYDLKVCGYRQSHYINTLSLSRQLLDFPHDFTDDMLELSKSSVTAFKAIVPLSHLEVICLPFGASWDMRELDWRNMFRQSRAVQHVGLSFHADADVDSSESDPGILLRALSAIVSQSPETQQDGVDILFPKLQTLMVAFPRGVVLGPAGNKLHSLLSTVLRTRKNAGAGVQNLIFVVAGGTSADHEVWSDGFEEAVNEVSWVEPPTPYHVEYNFSL